MRKIILLSLLAISLLVCSCTKSYKPQAGNSVASVSVDNSQSVKNFLIDTEDLNSSKKKFTDVYPSYNSNLFENDIFFNILLKYVYEDDPSFTIKEYTYDHKLDRGEHRYNMIIKNDAVEKNYSGDSKNDYYLRYIDIIKYTDDYCFGNLIGISSEKLLKLFSDSTSMIFYNTFKETNSLNSTGIYFDHKNARGDQIGFSDMAVVIIFLFQNDSLCAIRIGFKP